MEINSLQGTGTYANPPDTTPPVDSTLLRNQNLEASQTNLDSKTTIAAQRAFEVDISREAQNRLAAQNTGEPVETGLTPSGDQTDQTITQAHEQSLIVNIVA